jgi:hypothetical protein
VVRPKRESVSDQLVRVFYGIYAVVGMVCFAAGLGILTSTVFNHALDLSSFVNEGIGDWVSWGAKSTLLPIVIVSVAVIVASHVAMLLRFLTSRSRPIGFVDAARFRIGHWLRWVRLNDAANAASMILLVTTASLAAGFWHFFPLVRASVEPIATASRTDLALLSPAYADTYHTHFRETFTLLTLFSATAWWTVMRFAARHGQKISRSMLAGGAVVTILSVAILSVPYRLLRHNKFDTTNWNGYRCYVIGARKADLLLFCPQAPVPRSFTVPRNDGTPSFGEPENIFTLLSPSTSRAQGEKP